MNLLAGLLITVATLEAAHATHEDYKAMAHEAYGYVQNIKTSACKSEGLLSLAPQGLDHLINLRGNDGFLNAVCSSIANDIHCGKREAPHSLKMELEAVIDCIHSSKSPHPPVNLNKICCASATQVASYFDKYLGQPAS